MRRSVGVGMGVVRLAQVIGRQRWNVGDLLHVRKAVGDRVKIADWLGVNDLFSDGEQIGLLFEMIISLSDIRECGLF